MKIIRCYDKDRLAKTAQKGRETDKENTEKDTVIKTNS